MDYRKEYKKHYGIDFGSDYQIHHIDFNHENNSIDNLILLPKELHQRLHQCFLNNGGIKTDNLFTFDCCKNQLWDSLLSNALREASEIYNDLQYWASCKEFEDMRLKSPESPMYFSYNQFRK